MAASSTNTIRVRLYFDYPPPAVSDCRMCWVLVDLNKCRVVADLASIIREKFDYSRRNILNLFIEDCYLPHTESIYVVRDNDSIRVKVDSTTQVNGLDTSSGHAKKRGRDTDDEETAENRMSVEWKKKKKKRKQEESERESNHAADSERNTNKQKKKKENKKRKMEEKQVTTKQTASTKGAAPPTAAQPVKNTKKARAPAINGKAKTQNVSSTDSSDSSSEEEEALCKTTSQKTLPKTPTSTSAAPVVSKVTPKGKVTATKPQPPPLSSSDLSSDTASSDEASRVKSPLKKTPLAKPTTTPATTTPTTSKVDTQDKTTPSRLQPGLPSSVPTTSAPAQRPIALGSTLAAKKGTEKPESSDSDSSEEEIKLVIKRPIQGMGMALAPAVGDPNLRGRGRGSPRGMERGRGRGQGQRLGEGRGGIGPWGGGRGGRGGGDGGPRGDQGFHFNYETGQQQQHQPSYLSDSLTNNSVVLRNPAESGPKRDYSIMPQLASPPPAGQRIAFKLLELTENYTPEVSEYKEGRIISFDYSTKQIELQLLSASQGHVEPGKFDLVYQNADGSESVEYAVSRGSRVTERWDSLLEPRLIMDN